MGVKGNICLLRLKIGDERILEALLALSVSLAVGLAVSRITRKFSLPAVTAYLVAGIIVGPCCLGLLGINGLGFVAFDDPDRISVDSFKLISEVALGFIAFSIGNEFRLSHLKETGKAATVIGIAQAVITTAIVDVAMVTLALTTHIIDVAAALVLGAIAAATAPAATLMVVRQYKAKGKLTDILLPVVAIDDAVGLVLFSVSFGIAGVVSQSDASADIFTMIGLPLLEVVLSLLLGAIMGIVLTFCEKFFHSGSKRLSLVVTFVLLTVALAKVTFPVGNATFGFSSLLVCMMLGTIFCNCCDFSVDLMEKSERWTAPLYIVFFVLSGAELNLFVFSDVMIIVLGLAFILVRSFSKYVGAYFSSKAVRCPDSVTKYLGITLLPQAGVALGMSMQAASLPGSGALIRNIVLFAVLMFELFGPSMAKWALTKAGDITPPKPVQRVPKPKV